MVKVSIYVLGVRLHFAYFTKKNEEIKKQTWPFILKVLSIYTDKN